MTSYERQGALLNRVFDQLADDSVSIGQILDACIRLAESRRDFANLWWLRIESIGLGDKREMASLDAEMAQALPTPAWQQLRQKLLLDYMERRRLTGDDGKEKVSSEGLRELEASLRELENLVESARPQAGLHPQDLYFAVESYQKVRTQTQAGIYGRQVILARVRTRLARYASETEAAVEFSQVATGAFERVRELVDNLLAELAPDALSKFKAAYDRVATGDPEARSHALLSCRRILQALADRLYPATNEIVTGPDGVERKMSADRYRSRLWQYIAASVPHDDTRRLMQASVEELGRRLDALDGLASKGVHADVTEAEVDIGVVQTYLLAGELLTLARGSRLGPTDAT